MRISSLILIVLVTLGLHSPAPLLADKILLISSGDQGNDAAIQAVLQSQGDTVTIGPTYNNFTGAGLSGYNAVFLNPSYQSNAAVSWYPWAFPPDMPTSGQQALINYVNQGGGLVTGGTVSYENITVYNGSPGNFHTLAAALPELTGQPATSNSPITFTAQTSNPTINAGLSSTFSFTAGGFNTEQFITPKPNATSFFVTNQWTTAFGGLGLGYGGVYSEGSGAVGWNYGAGRVLSLSTFSDNVALSNATYDRMLTNAFNWATQTTGSPPSPFPPINEAPVPEPTTLTVFVLAGLGLLIGSRIRRRIHA